MPPTTCVLHAALQRWCLCALLCLLAVSTRVACGQQSYPVYWVSVQTGSDANDGLTPQTAWRTIQKAYDVAQPGIYTYVLPGIYEEAIVSRIEGSDNRTWNSSNDGWIRIYGTNHGQGVVPNGTVIIRPPAGQPAFTLTHRWNAIHNYTIEGGTHAVRIMNTTGPYWLGALTMTNQTSHAVYATSMDNSVGGAHAINLNNSLIQNPGGDGARFERCIRVSVNSNVLILNAAGNGITYIDSIHPTQDYMEVNGVTIRNSAGDGIYLDGTAISSNVLRSRIENNAGWGVNAANNWGSVYVNIITGNMLGGVRNASSTNRNRSMNVYHNTMHANTGPAVLLDSSNATITAVNNIYSSNTTALRRIAGTLTARTSLFWNNATDYDGVSAHANDRVGDPLYQNAALSDFDLTSGSAAIDAGEVPPSWCAFDFRQAMRPWGSGTDVGAYEIIPIRITPPYVQDFEGAVGGEWARSQTVSVAGFSTASGAFAQPTPGDQALAVNTVVGRYYRVFYDVIYFDDWRGYRTGPNAFNHFFYIDRNNARAVTARMGQPWDLMDPWKGAEVWGTNLGMGSANDQVCFQQWFDFVADDDFTVILFRSTGWTDGTASRSFAIDNVRITDNIAPNNVFFTTPWTRRYRDLAMHRNFRAHSADGPTVAGPIFTGFLDNDAVQDFILGGNNRSSPASATAILGNPNTWIASQVSLGARADRGGALLDIDNDGDLDFWALSSANTRTLLRNNGAGTFVDAGPLTFTGPINQEGVIAADMNRDGWCDLVHFDGVNAGNIVGLNTRRPNANGTSVVQTIEPSTDYLPNTALDSGDGWYAASVDANNDGYIDFYYPFADGRLFLSNADGTYTRDNRGIAVTPAGPAGAVWADFNNDSWPDLLVCDRSGPVTLWRNPGAAGNFTNVAPALNINVNNTTSAAFGDYDNDGDLDLYLVRTQGRNVFLRNRGSSNGFAFEELDEGVNVISEGGDAAFADLISMDGHLELVVTSEAGYPTRVFEPTFGTNDRLQVRLLGRGEFGTTTGGNGARIDLLTSAGVFLQRRDLGGGRGFGGQGSLIAHFGGVSANTTYIIRVTSGRHTYEVRTTPAAATTTIAGRVLVRFLTINEAAFVPYVDVASWEEVGQDP